MSADQRPRSGLPVPSVEQAITDATHALHTNPDDNIAASVLWLADQLHQANQKLAQAEAAITIEVEKRRA